MTTDIVERLRAVDLDMLWRDALAEIEQLRARLSVAEGCAVSGKDGLYLSAVVSR